MRWMLGCVVTIFCCLVVGSSAAPEKPKPAKSEKLVVILLDGSVFCQVVHLYSFYGHWLLNADDWTIDSSFRWDYVEQQGKEALPAFRQLHKDGVRAKWVNPIFPSLSYASWTTLSTGKQTFNKLAAYMPTKIVRHNETDVILKDKW